MNIFSFPEVEFFHKEAIQEMMLDLLFCFCKTHPELSYKQVLWLLLLPVMRWFLEWLLVFAPFTINELRGGGGVSKIQTIRLAYLLTLLWSGLWKGWCLQSHIAYLCTLPFSWPSPPHTTMCPFSIVVKLKVLNAPKSFLTKHYGFLSHRPLDFFSLPPLRHITAAGVLAL